MDKENLIFNYVDHNPYLKVTEVRRGRNRILSDLDVNSNDKPQISNKRHLTPTVLYENTTAELQLINDGGSRIIPKATTYRCVIQPARQREIREQPIVKKQIITNGVLNKIELRNNINTHLITFNNKKQSNANLPIRKEYFVERKLYDMMRHASKASLSMKYYKILFDIAPSHTCVFSYSLLRDIVHTNGAQPTKFYLTKDYLKRFNYNEITRTEVINWLYKLLNFLGVNSQIIFSCVRIFDYLLSIIYIHTDLLQLVALTMFWIIHKLDNNRKPFLASTLVTFCNNIYTKYNILDMEIKLLKALNYDMFMQDTTYYIEYFAYVCPSQHKCFVKRCATYILECFIFVKDFSVVLELYLAIASVKISMDVVCKTVHSWEEFNFIEWKMDYNMLNIIQRKMYNQLHKIQNEDYKFREPYKKYGTKQYGNISQFVKQQLPYINLNK